MSKVSNVNDQAGYEEGCVFCRIVAGIEPATVVRSDDRTVAFLDRAPGTFGHTLVVPRRHSRDLLDAEPDDVAAVAQATQVLARAARTAFGAEGVNVLQASGQVAFQTIFHLHFHMLPRYSDDNIVRPWLPRVGDPAEMERAGRMLRHALGGVRKESEDSTRRSESESQETTIT
ncbi:MAG: HIT family protein [Acidimicrobiales bacterium]